ncbi:MAG: hypothetical protein ACWGOX_12945, partial [Desulforhopalus sp.]
KGAAQKIEIQPAELDLDDMQIILSGSVRPGSAGGLQVDLDLDTDRVDLDKLITDIKGLRKPSGKNSGAIYNPLPISGEISLRSKEFKAKTVVIQPLQADIRVKKGSAEITFKKVDLCNIPVAGTIELSPQDIAYHLEADGKGQQLKPALTCLNNQNINADGLFDLAGSLEGTVEGIGEVTDLFKVSSGHFGLGVADGHIYRDFLFLNVLKFLNINKVITDRALGETKEKGLAFKRLETQITVENGKLKYNKIVLDSNMMKLTGAGEIDLAKNRIHFTLLVAPQTAINSILGYVPLVGSLLQTIATIPLGVRGTVDDVHILPLSPSAVGYEIKEVMKHTLGLPMKLIRLGDFVRQ